MRWRLSSCARKRKCRCEMLRLWSCDSSSELHAAKSKMLQEKLIAADKLITELQQEKSQNEFLVSVGEKTVVQKRVKSPEAVADSPETSDGKLEKSPSPSEVESAQQAQIEYLEQQIA